MHIKTTYNDENEKNQNLQIYNCRSCGIQRDEYYDDVIASSSKEAAVFVAFREFKKNQRKKYFEDRLVIEVIRLPEYKIFEVKLISNEWGIAVKLFDFQKTNLH